MGTDRDWEKWGSADPYFGVLSEAVNRRAQFDDSAREAFFQSGEQHIESVMQLLEGLTGTKPDLSATLDFGCGVGRLCIPLAKRSSTTLGVDVSASMLAEAGRNARLAGIENLVLQQSNGEVIDADHHFTLIHSYIVLQHISWRRGRRIVRHLATKVAPGGLLALHFLTASSASWIVQKLIRLRYALPPANWLRNVVRGRPVFEPAMQLHVYDKEAIRQDLAQLGFDAISWARQDDVGEFSSTYVLARRSASAH